MNCLQLTFENYLWNDLIFIVETKGWTGYFFIEAKKKGTIDRKKVVSGPR